MKTINYQGRQIEVEELDVLNSNEHWNEYQLSDGTELSMRTVLVKVFRAINERNQEGEPLYITSSQNIVKAKTAHQEV